MTNKNFHIVPREAFNMIFVYLLMYCLLLLIINPSSDVQNVTFKLQIDPSSS